MHRSYPCSSAYSHSVPLVSLGLKYDDLIPEESEVVQEALRRLPPREFQDRLFRFKRAFALSGTQNVLPSSEWTKPEQVRKSVTSWQTTFRIPSHTSKTCSLTHP